MTTPTAKAYDRTSYILVVDDDNTLLKFFKIHLNKFYSRVIVVPSPKEAIQALKERTVDLVISDIIMGRLDGFGLMKKVRNYDPSIPVFLVSGALLDEDQQEAVDSADGFLKKPFSIEELHGYIDHGLKIRTIYKEVYDLVPEKKKFWRIIQREAQVDVIKKVENRERVLELLAQLDALNKGTDAEGRDDSSAAGAA